LKNDTTQFVKVDHFTELSTVSISEENGGHQTTTSHLELTGKKLNCPEFMSILQGKNERLYTGKIQLI